ncbi:MAG: hypothetical protein L0H70_04425, partial [Xanthomonadales bacterium]|nr:hypothetical protein [Xanthomonadales bacterium]
MSSNKRTKKRSARAQQSQLADSAESANLSKQQDDEIHAASVEWVTEVVSASQSLDSMATLTTRAD